MKKLLLISICLFAGAFMLSAQKTVYVIDNETVEHFDGSQLKGKTVKDYKITTSGTGRKAVTVHAITTSPSFFSVSGTFKPLESLQAIDTTTFIKPAFRKIVYIIDGEVHEEASAFNSISPFDIENITVLKEGSPEQRKYGENVIVMKITTKKDKTDMKEVLKRLPGVKIEADGSITINGAPVKKISINGRAYSVDTE